MARSVRSEFGQLPADHHAGEHVDDEGGVDPARMRLDVGQVGDPQPVGRPARNLRSTRSAGRCWRSSERVVTL